MWFLQRNHFQKTKRDEKDGETAAVVMTLEDKIKELEEELDRLKELNTKLSKGIAYEMQSNFAQAHLRQKLEIKLEKVEEWVTNHDNTGIGNQTWTELKEILKEKNTSKPDIDPALQSKLDAKKKFLDSDFTSNP